MTVHKNLLLEGKINKLKRIFKEIRNNEEDISIAVKLEYLTAIEDLGEFLFSSPNKEFLNSVEKRKARQILADSILHLHSLFF